MQPSKLSIVELFQQREQYLIPLFQRGYVWTLERHIQPLWEDILDRVEAMREHEADGRKVSDPTRLKPVHKHFLGAIVVGGPDSGDSTRVATRDVIDGQQRITTFQIMLLALRDLLKGISDEGLLYDLKNLTHNAGSYSAKSDNYKVWPTNAGREVFHEIARLGDLKDVCQRFPVRAADRKPIERPAMVQAYLYFSAILACHLRGKRFDDSPVADGDSDEETISQRIVESIGKDNLVVVPFEDLEIDLVQARDLLKALQNCFQIMRLQLDSEDDPQIIFETLNARGAPLQPSDLVRNFIFLRAARLREPVDEIYESYWRDYDEKADSGTGKFWQKAETQGRLKNSRLDLLLYHYVALRKLDELKVSHVFDEFKRWWEQKAGSTDAELKRLRHLATYFETIVAPDQKSRFGLFCRRMQLLDTATLTPVLLYLLEHHRPDDKEFVSALEVLESYVVRRFVCGLDGKNYNRLFVQRVLATMVRQSQADAAALRDLLLSFEGPSQKWPDDEEFKTAWCHRQLYKGNSTRKVRAILEGLELGPGKTNKEITLELGELTVEHVMPQKWQAEWPLASDDAATKEKRERLLHSIGNLTLLTQPFNSELSNGPFASKRSEIAANSRLALNAYFQKLKNEGPWDEDTIVARAEHLFKTAVKVWPR